MPLSIFIITLNEADRITPVIRAALRLTDDIVVVDSGSHDGTVELCQSLGARVIHLEFTGYGAQKRFAEDQCKYDWLLNLDADEVMPEGLINEIQSVIATHTSSSLGPERSEGIDPRIQKIIKVDPGVKPQDEESAELPRNDRALAFTIPIAEVFPGEAAPHKWAYTLKPVRLYHKSAGRYNPSPVHDRVDLLPNTRIGHLKTPIHHFSVRSMGDQISKLNRYSDRQAEDLEARGVTIPTWRVLFEFPAAFIKAYFFRRHFLRGVYGFVTAMNYAFSRHLRIVKHLEQRWRKNTK